MYGSIAAAMHLAEVAAGNGGGVKQRAVRTTSGSTSKRVFQSKLLGGLVGKGDPKVYEASTPGLRAKALIAKLL